MDNEIVAQVGTLLAKNPSLRIPFPWFSTLGNHTACVVLADILSAYLDDGCERLWDRNELILEYKAMAERFQVSGRSISRAVNVLCERGAIRRSLHDRSVRGKVRRNIVGVVLNIGVIADLSRIRLDDILSASNANSRQGVQPAPAGDKVVILTDFQESLVRAYEDEFGQSVGHPYRTSQEQRLADRKAVGNLTIGKTRGAGRKYLVWARQYLEALKEKAEEEHGAVVQGAFDRRGNVTNRFTVESFLFWANSNQSLPNGFSRRSFT